MRCVADKCTDKQPVGLIDRPAIMRANMPTRPQILLEDTRQTDRQTDCMCALLQGAGTHF